MGAVATVWKAKLGRSTLDGLHCLVCALAVLAGLTPSKASLTVVATTNGAIGLVLIFRVGPPVGLVWVRGGGGGRFLSRRR